MDRRRFLLASLAGAFTGPSVFQSAQICVWERTTQTSLRAIFLDATNEACRRTASAMVVKNRYFD
jgi:hypothetical protein